MVSDELKVLQVIGYGTCTRCHMTIAIARVGHFHPPITKGATAIVSPEAAPLGIDRIRFARADRYIANQEHSAPKITEETMIDTLDDP